MSPERFAFVNSAMVVVNVIVGELTPSQLAQFERDYAILFGAEFSVPVYEGTTVWVGGTYTDGTFSPPPQPEPLPEIVEGESEVLPEPEATGA